MSVSTNVKLFITCFMLVLLQCTVYGQSKGTMVEDAQALFDNKEYGKAYDAYDKLNAKYPKDFDFKFKLGLCCLNFVEKKARAVEVFEGIKIEIKSPAAAFYLGKRLREPTPEEKLNRSKALHQLNRRKYGRFQEKHIGQSFEALVLEQGKDGYKQALLSNQIPVTVKTGEENTGQIINVNVDSLKNGGLVALQV